MEAEVQIRNLQKKISLKANPIEKIVRAILRLERVLHSDLSVVFVTDQKIKSLNKKYLKKTYATDVLAFDLKGFEVKSRKRRVRRSIVGEIIISTDTVARNARRFGTSIKRELTLCIIHGVLHLCGYNDHRPKDIKRMRQREQKILNRLTR